MAQARRSSGEPELSTVRQCVASHAESTPDVPAILAPGRAGLSHRDLLAQVDAAAGALRRHGLRPGQRVAVVLPNGPEMAVAFLAASTVCTCAPLNPALRPQEYEFHLADLKAAAVIVPASGDHTAARVARDLDIPVLTLHVDDDVPAGVFRLEPTGEAAGAGAVSGASDVALVLHTSGTTSRPKLVPLTHANLCASARNVVASLALGPRDRCLNVMPLFHIHGLVAALLASVASGGSVVCPPGFDEERFFDWAQEFQPTWYTAVPTMHQAILSRVAAGADRGACRSLRFIRSCSSALPPTAMAGLEGAFGVPVVEAYGMTEASHQMACSPLPPGERKPGSVGLATGTRIAIMNEAGDILSAGETGEIVIRGDSVTAGYEANPQANAAAFTRGWFRTGDEGRLDADGYLYITGRIKEIINRGGEKVSPREVDEALLAHPGVAQAVTFAVPHPRLGEEIAALVVPKDGAPVGELELRRFAAERLAVHKIPRKVIIGDSIPKGPTGKPQRIGLAAQLQDRLTPEFRPPAGPAEQVLAAIWRDLLEMDRVGVDDNFFLSGGTSLLAARLVSRFREETGTEIPLDCVFRYPTIAGLAAVAGAGPSAAAGTPNAQQPWPVVLPVQAGGSRPPFFMVSFGIGWETGPLSRHLGPDQPVYSLRPPPERSEELRRMGAEALAAFYVREMRKVRPHGPYVLGGGCAAGLIAYEMAQQLVREGVAPPPVCLFDVYWPPPGFLPYGPACWLMRLPRTLGLYAAERPRERFVHVCRRSWFWLGKLAGIGRRSTDAETGPLEGDELAGYIRQLAESQPAGIWRYRPLPYPGRVGAFLSADTGVWPFPRQRLRWEAVAGGGFDVVVIPGEHHHALEEPHAAAAARALRRFMDSAGGEAGRRTR
jgi:acyl-CoA synthetase (AMP-forming)/AMP-acid ligase II/thioesterase domain-containing protein